MAEKETMYDVGLREPGIDRFLRVRGKRASEHSLKEYIKAIGYARTVAGKPLMEMTVEEVEELAVKLSNGAKSRATMTKMFFKVHKMRDQEDALSGLRDNSRRMSLNEILMPEDVSVLINAARNFRDRAILSLLAASGARVEEIVSLRMKNLIRTESGGFQAWIGKPKVPTQGRYTPEIDGILAEHLTTWLRSYPAAKNPEAPLFPSLDHPDKPIGTEGVRKMLRHLVGKTEIKKPINPHAWRRARVTWGVIRKEDLSRLCLGVWGKAWTPMLNRYNFFNNLNVKLGEVNAPVDLNLQPLPEPPQFASTAAIIAQAKDEARKEIMAEIRAELIRLARGEGMTILTEQADKSTRHRLADENPKGVLEVTDKKAGQE